VEEIMGQEFLDLFARMGTVSLVTIILGLVLMLIEIFSPKFGVFGIPGAISMLIGVIFRFIEGVTLFQGGMLIAILGVFVVVMIIAVVRSTIQRGTAVPTNHNEISKDRLELKGKTGIVTIACHPIGKALIEGKEYEVLAYQSRFITDGTDIIVRSVTNEAISVEKLKSDDGGY
jgi:membrane-bound serine protease (ClpP class)